MLNPTDPVIVRLEHNLRVDSATRYGWRSPFPHRARRRIHSTTAPTPIARSARYALTALAAVALGRGLSS